VDVEYLRDTEGMTSATVSIEGSDLVRSCEDGANRLLKVPEATKHMDNHLPEVVVMLREWAQLLAEEDGRWKTNAGILVPCFGTRRKDKCELAWM